MFLKEENNAEIIAKIPLKINGKIHFFLTSTFCSIKCVDISASNIKKVDKTGADKIKKTPIWKKNQLFLERKLYKITIKYIFRLS